MDARNGKRRDDDDAYSGPERRTNHTVLPSGCPTSEQRRLVRPNRDAAPSTDRSIALSTPVREGTALGRNALESPPFDRAHGVLDRGLRGLQLVDTNHDVERVVHGVRITHELDVLCDLVGSRAA